MTQAQHSDDSLRRLVLGQASEEAAAGLEEAVFEDDELFGQALELEDDLIDDFARGRLSDEERKAIEQRIAAHPAFARRIAFARSFVERDAHLDEMLPNVVRIEKSEAWRRRRFRYLAAAAIITPLIAGLLYTGSRNDSTVAMHRRLPGKPLVPSIIQPLVPQVATLALTLASTRGEQAVPAVALGKASSLHLSISIDPSETYKEFQLLLRDGHGAKVWSGSGTLNASAVAVDLPAKELRPGRYELEVRGGSSSSSETIGYQQIDIR